MIRFCDKEINYISMEMLRSETKENLMNYFKEETAILCIVDSAARYCGYISFAALLQSEILEESIMTDAVTLDNHIWEKGRLFFRMYREEERTNILLPVIDEEEHLLYFAFEDEDANREIRELRELSECKCALNFHDLYPEVQCVTIIGCNELAWSFMSYLQMIDIPVKVEGKIWERLCVANIETKECLEYNQMTIYAEGTWRRKELLKEEMLRSVSVEFECVDEIYGANVRNGVIKDADGSFKTLVERLKIGLPVYILGTNIISQDVYDLFSVKNIDINAFIRKDENEYADYLLGKPIIDRMEIEAAEECIFIECESKCSSGGFGGVDQYDYDGYKRNEHYFLINDYIDISRTMLKNILSKQQITLTGDVFLCKKAYQYFTYNGHKNDNIKYCDFGWNKEKEDVQCEMEIIDADCLSWIKQSICLIVLPLCFSPKQELFYLKEKWYIERLRQCGNINYSSYFSSNEGLLEMDINRNKYPICEYRPSKILCGITNHCSGNSFLLSLLDNHPNIICIDNSFFNRNLFSICMRLSECSPEEIPAVFWKIYLIDTTMAQVDDEKWVFPQRERFENRLKELLRVASKFTAQQLFVIFHMAYLCMFGRDIINMENVVLYWDPHGTERNEAIKYLRWLEDKEVSCVPIRFVRDCLTSAGSQMKFWKRRNVFSSLPDVVGILNCPYEPQYECEEEIVLKFEDVKLHPKEDLYALSEKLEIPWSDNMLSTTRYGKTAVFHGVTGFDLSPVFGKYEEFFSEYDRMRICLSTSRWQKKYGYPYINGEQFTRSELQEMFLKEFHYEKMWMFQTKEDKLDYEYKKQKKMRKMLWKFYWENFHESVIW